MIVKKPLNNLNRFNPMLLKRQIFLSSLMVLLLFSACGPKAFLKKAEVHIGGEVMLEQQSTDPNAMMVLAGKDPMRHSKYIKTLVSENLGENGIKAQITEESVQIPSETNVFRVMIPFAMINRMQSPNPEPGPPVDMPENPDEVPDGSTPPPPPPPVPGDPEDPNMQQSLPLAPMMIVMSAELIAHNKSGEPNSYAVEVDLMMELDEQEAIMAKAEKDDLPKPDMEKVALKRISQKLSKAIEDKMVEHYKSL